jgi:hypothetical protein
MGHHLPIFDASETRSKMFADAEVYLFRALPPATAVIHAAVNR